MLWVRKDVLNTPHLIDLGDVVSPDDAASS